MSVSAIFLELVQLLFHLTALCPAAVPFAHTLCPRLQVLHQSEMSVDTTEFRRHADSPRDAHISQSVNCAARDTTVLLSTLALFFCFHFRDLDAQNYWRICT